MPEIAYVLGKEGGEIWTDFYAIPKDAPNKPAGYALLNYPDDPADNAVKEHLANGCAVDRRAGQQAAAEGDAGEPDPLSGGGPADAAGIRRCGDADRSRAGPRLMARFKSA